MLVRDIKPRPGDRLLVPGDMHIPLHDESLLQLLVRYRKSWGVNGVVLIGDTFDCFGLSRHQKNALQMADRGSIAKEAAVAKPILSALGAGMKYRYAITGNHEDWFDDLVDDNPALAGMTWADAYSSALSGWEVLPYGTAAKAGKLLITHGDELAGSLSKFSANSVVSNYPEQNTLYGHTHVVDVRTHITYKYGVQEKHIALTVGHCRDMKKIQMDKTQRSWARRWEQGFALVTILEKGNFHIDQIRPWKDGDKSCAFVHGKVWR